MLHPEPDDAKLPRGARDAPRIPGQAVSLPPGVQVCLTKAGRGLGAPTVGPRPAGQCGVGGLTLAVAVTIIIILGFS